MTKGDAPKKAGHRRDDGAKKPAPADAAEEPAAADDVAGATATAAVPEPDERYLRLAADFENFRRRKNQELVDRSRYASEDAAKALLPILDNLRRAVGHAREEGSADLADGLELVVREFEAALDRLGVTVIEAMGQRFDPSVHEAIGVEANDDVDVDTVAAEVQRGYRLHDRVLRPALVRVAHPAQPPGGA